MGAKSAKPATAINREFVGVHATAWGDFWFAVTPAGVTQLTLPGSTLPANSGSASTAPPAEVAPIVTALKSWIDARLAGDFESAPPPTFVTGTDFQCAVWRAMAAIPLGETRTYGAIADAIGSPGAARAVGQACGKNPIPLIVPCHRVVAAGGIGGGFSAAGGKITKKALIAWEKAAANGGEKAAPSALFSAAKQPAAPVPLFENEEMQSDAR